MAGTGNGDKSGGGSSTPIIVALITVAGVMFTALAANWDKIFGGRAAPAMSQSAAATPANDASAVKDAAQKLSDSQKQTYGAATSALDDVTRQIEGASKPDITGVWAGRLQFQRPANRRRAQLSGICQWRPRRPGSGRDQRARLALQLRDWRGSRRVHRPALGRWQPDQWAVQECRRQCLAIRRDAPELATSMRRG